MLIAIGQFSTDFLLQNASQMAQDNLSEHELNQFQKGTFKHPDGWGIAQLSQQTETWNLYKSTNPIWQDLENNKEKILSTITSSNNSNQEKAVTIIHARRATVGDIRLENNHPFELTTTIPYTNQHQKFIFCHNGTIKDHITPHKDYALCGSTDSEKLFHQIISKYIETNNPLTIKETINQFNYPGSCNVILSNVEKSIVSINCKKNPLYTQMYLHQNQEGIIISSEQLPTYQNTTILPNESIIIIEHKTMTVTKISPKNIIANLQQNHTKEQIIPLPIVEQ